MGKQGT